MAGNRLFSLIPKLQLSEALTNLECPMYAEKLSISLPTGLVGFIERYRVMHAMKSRSQVIGEALELLRQRELEMAYREANQETDTDFDIALADGLGDETW